MAGLLIVHYIREHRFHGRSSPSRIAESNTTELAAGLTNTLVQDATYYVKYQQITPWMPDETLCKRPKGMVVVELPSSPPFRQQACGLGPSCSSAGSHFEALLSHIGQVLV